MKGLLTHLQRADISPCLNMLRSLRYRWLIEWSPSAVRHRIAFSAIEPAVRLHGRATGSPFDSGQLREGFLPQPGRPMSCTLRWYPGHSRKTRFISHGWTTRFVIPNKSFIPFSLSARGGAQGIRSWPEDACPLREEAPCSSRVQARADQESAAKPRPVVHPTAPWRSYRPRWLSKQRLYDTLGLILFSTGFPRRSESPRGQAVIEGCS